MSGCSHDGVSINVNESGVALMVHAGRTAAFSADLLAAASEDITMDGDTLTVCGNLTYRVTDWNHRCPGWGNTVMALAELVAVGSSDVRAF